MLLRYLLAAFQIYATNLSPTHPSIRYSEGPFDNPVTRLDVSKLTISPGGLGYLPGQTDSNGKQFDTSTAQIVRLFMGIAY